jgi:hypothetical protein
MFGGRMHAFMNQGAFRALWRAAALVLAMAAAVHAQVLSGSLVVDVRDQSGAAVPGAEVTITQT